MIHDIFENSVHSVTILHRNEPMPLSQIALFVYEFASPVVLYDYFTFFRNC